MSGDNTSSSCVVVPGGLTSVGPVEDHNYSNNVIVKLN